MAFYFRLFVPTVLFVLQPSVSTLSRNGCRPQNPENEKRLKKQSYEAFAVGVEAETVSLVDELCDVSWEDCNEECGNQLPDQHSITAYQGQ